MLIEFKIQMDGSATPSVTQAEAGADPNLPANHQLPTSYVPPSAAVRTSTPQSQACVNTAVTPTGIASSSGSGAMFVIGPIVINGTGPGHTGPGGGQPVGGPGPGGGQPVGGPGPGGGQPVGGPGPGGGGPRTK